MITNEKIVNFIRNNIKPDVGILKDLREYAILNKVPIAQPETAAFLRVITSIKRPERILEAGTAIGYSALIMAENLAHNGIIDTIERNEEVALLARDNIKKAGYENHINVIIADAKEVFSCIDKQYDMIFMDAGKSQYLDMLKDAIRILKPGGILVSDNVLFRGKVAEDEVDRKYRSIVSNLKEYLSLLCDSDDFETCLLPVGDGISLAIKKS